MKAHRRRRLGFGDIEILPSALGDGDGGASTAPRAWVRREQDSGAWDEVMLSISHDGEYAVAMCVAYESGRES